MTLAEELAGIHLPWRLVRWAKLEEPPLHLPFNGDLSYDELRMIFEGQLDES